ncbi:MAG: hypothetical protein ACI9P8_001277, partial [Bacteroidia bacterium]
EFHAVKLGLRTKSLNENIESSLYLISPTPTAMQIAAFLLFTLFVAVYSYFATRKTDEDSADGYFLGGRSLRCLSFVSLRAE